LRLDRNFNTPSRAQIARVVAVRGGIGSRPSSGGDPAYAQDAQNLVAAPHPVVERPQVRGKFLFAGGEKLYVRGVTYGTFRPDEDGNEFSREDVERDFAAMASAGINALRTYTVPPRWLLDAALRHGLYVMVGVPWEQHVAFLEDDAVAKSIVERVRAGVRSCARHPAVLCYGIGNEIPAPIVRWHGRRSVERFLERLHTAAKDEDPDGLVTYVNYPSTEYLELPFADLMCFNVYLEAQRTLEAYLARLHNLAGDRPLLMAEIGLDSSRNGEDTQARVLRWQVETAFSSGCAGAFVFAWTDEWHRGGHDIEDWDFGLTDRDRQPKPALAAVADTFERAPFPEAFEWPTISVVVCTHNGAQTIADTLEGIDLLDYPAYEVIVVDDGSTDDCAAIAEGFGARVISTENRGLSAARNIGSKAASGEIVAFTDDDARPDPHWLTYLAIEFARSEHVAVGGPNIAPIGDGPIADCVANSPGGPIHVLLADRVAEHIPGCNMAVRRSALIAVGGFDPIYRAAGDDVDMCWRLQERGWTIGFAPAAMVWHHRRNSLRAYWRQQRGYGKAEALLERKWPEKYNSLGHLRWSGRMYGRGITRSLSVRRERVHHGTWGTGLFQSLYKPADGTFASLVLMPEWYLLIALLLALSGLGLVSPHLWLALPLAGAAALAVVAQAILSARRASFQTRAARRRDRLGLRVLTALLYLVQPAARLHGRMVHGLTPWRKRVPRAVSVPRPRTLKLWSESWQSTEDRLGSLERDLRSCGHVVRPGGAFDRWDLELRVGLAGVCRARMAIEEHGEGNQLVRVRRWPRWGAAGRTAVAFFAVLAALTALDGAWFSAGVLGLFGAGLLVSGVLECARAVAALDRALQGGAVEARVVKPTAEAAAES
jgi:GT2 family glycosyltransferase